MVNTLLYNLLIIYFKRLIMKLLSFFVLFYFTLITRHTKIVNAASSASESTSSLIRSSDFYLGKELIKKKKFNEAIKIFKNL